MRKLIAGAAFGAAMLASASASAAPNLLVNGSFEQIALSAGSWGTYNSLPGWTSTAGIELRNNIAGTAYDGSQYVELDTGGNSSIMQTVSTAAGQHYLLSFYYSPRAGVSSASNTIDVFWNGVKLDSVTGSGVGQSNHVWGARTYDVTGIAGSSILSFAAAGNSDSVGGSLDNASLTAAVPEPETYAMLMAGLGIMGAVARKRKQAQSAA